MLTAGMVATIDGFAPEMDHDAEQRLRELGLDEGLPLVMVRRLPMGGPVIVGFGRVEVALRPAEARLIAVKP